MRWGNIFFSPFQLACLHWWNLAIEERLPLSYINSVYIWFSMNCKVLLISTQRETFSLSRVTLWTTNQSREIERIRWKIFKWQAFSWLSQIAEIYSIVGFTFHYLNGTGSQIHQAGNSALIINLIRTNNNNPNEENNEW